MSMIVAGGSTDITTYFQMRLLTGGDATALTITAFDLSYTRTRATTSAKVDASDLGSANAAHTDNGGYEVDPTDCPGLHRFDWPDAAFAAGVAEVILTVKHTSCFTESLRVTIDPFGAAGAGLTALATQTSVNTIDDFLDTEIAAIKAKTDNLPADPADASDIAAAFALVDTDLSNIEADTQDLQARTPAALTAGGNMKSDALAISGSTESADRLERSTLAIVTGTVGVGSTATSLVASALSPASVINDQFVGRIITFDKDTTTTALRGQATDITDYVHATLTFTVTALTSSPASTDTFTIT